ncbi:MAG: hypothetical protein ACI4GB_10010 [Acutalibacteraceae bacterium]
MRIFDRIKKSFNDISNISVNEEKIFDTQDKTMTVQFLYPELFEKCQKIYALITEYECQLSGKDGINFYKRLYKDTGDKMYLDLLEEAKHSLFIKSTVIKELIACGREKYKLSKEDFFDCLKKSYKIIAFDEDFSSDFCFDFLKNEIESYYFYDQIKHVDLSLILKKLLFNNYQEIFDEAIHLCKNNICPYCGKKQEIVSSRSKKCSECQNKIYIKKIFGERMFFTKLVFDEIEQKLKEYEAKLDFCNMLKYAGFSEEQIEKHIMSGSRINEFVWRELSKLRNRYYEFGQIDLVSRIDFNLAKILIYEKKYKTAIVFLCEAIYADYSPIAFHPQFPYRKVGNQIININTIDTQMYNERHQPFINEAILSLLYSLKDHFQEEEFFNSLQEAFEECTHFYLILKPMEVYNAVVDRMRMQK